MDGGGGGGHQDFGCGGGGGGKRARAPGGMNAEGENDLDAAVFTRRHLQHFEQRKEAEMAKLKEEAETVVREKEAEVAAVREEAGQQARQLEQALGENRILKRAVAIQDGKLRQGTAELEAAKRELAQGQEEMRRLMQMNYALQVRLQQTMQQGGAGYMPEACGGSGFDDFGQNDPPPPDVF